MANNDFARENHSVQMLLSGNQLRLWLTRAMDRIGLGLGNVNWTSGFPAPGLVWRGGGLGSISGCRALCVALYRMSRRDFQICPNGLISENPRSD